MLGGGGLIVSWCVAASSLGALIYLLVGAGRDPVRERMKDLAGAANAGTSESRGFGSGGVEANVDRATARDRSIHPWTSRRLRQQEMGQGTRELMMQAGMYTPGIAGAFVYLRLVLLVAPGVLGVAVSMMGYVSMFRGLFLGVVVGVAGTLAPGLWLGHVKRARQAKIRRALPDALDVMIICLEGGLSLTGALSRVAHELSTAHPMLGAELQIVERQMQMGLSTGEAIRSFAGRFDLEELRSMASVIIQAERVGSSVVNSLEVYAETLRLKRRQRAEELAHQASVKMLFPTVFFIFPAVFVVVLGPAAIQIYQQLIQGIMHGTGR